VLKIEVIYWRGKVSFGHERIIDEVFDGNVNDEG
jgi:hypothetical protein